MIDAAAQAHTLVSDCGVDDIESDRQVRAHWCGLHRLSRHRIVGPSGLSSRARELGACAAGTTDLSDRWGDSVLASYLDRTADQRRACDEKHQPWPGRAAHTRHTSDDAAARRLRLFRDDVDPTPDAEQTVTLLAL